MPGPFTGSLGWTGALPVLLGGPPLVNTYARAIPAQATPLIAHAYQNDGVTFIKSLGPLSNRPPVKAMLANGGFEQITLELPAKPTGITQGNVVRLSQQGGDGSFVYSGIVEALPDTISATKTLHEVILSPFGFELDDTYTQLVYSTPTDITAAVRQAVALTQHCSCDQVSVPPTTGILLAQNGQVDFRNQTVKQVLDTCRSIAGPTWFWHVDELGRVWFQAQGSAAAYTVTRRQYEERVTDGGSIQQLKNQVVAVGGVPTGGSANIQATYNGTSQSLYGVRSLNPPLSIPNITDQATLSSIAANVGTVLDRVKTQVKLTVREGYGIKIHAAQPGGATVRYWEAATDALVESGAGSGTYSGPYIGTDIEWDGTTQKVAAGDIAVTSQTDVDNMVQSLVARAAATSLQVTGAALNLQQTMTGTFQSGTSTASQSGVNPVPAALWRLNQQEFAVIDQFGVTRAEMGNLLANGISPAQWGFRANKADGTPLFDSLGLIAVANVLATEAPGTSVMAGSGSGWTTKQTISGSGSSFTLQRSGNVLCLSTLSVFMNAGAGNYCALFHAIWQGGSLIARKQISATGFTQGINWYITGVALFMGLAAGTYTFRQEFALDAATTDVEFGTGAAGIPPVAEVIQLGA